MLRGTATPSKPTAVAAPHAQAAPSQSTEAAALKLMVLLDGSPTSEFALETAIDWARGHPRATLLLVHAIELVKFTAGKFGAVALA